MAEKDVDKSVNNIVYLHGDLELKIMGAQTPPMKDLIVGSTIRSVSLVSRTILLSKILPGYYWFDLIRVAERFLPSSKSRLEIPVARRFIPSVKAPLRISVYVAGTRVARTGAIFYSQAGDWNQDFEIQLAHPVSEMEFCVEHKDAIGRHSVIGRATVSAEKIAKGELIEETVPVNNLGFLQRTSLTSVNLRMKLTPCHQNPIYSKGVKGDFRECYFPLCDVGKVTLYQDAHVIDRVFPEIELDNKTHLEHGKCWEDIFDAILNAKYLVYIAGWSIGHMVKLKRDEPTNKLPNGRDSTLGELLKYKSEQGIKVLLLVWCDTANVMGTHDGEVVKFFLGSRVICVPARRYKSVIHSFRNQKVGKFLYSHHQKCVIVDTQGHGNNRKITSFIGGLDLCKGRYDTPEHRLFPEPNSVFHDDFYNPICSADGPRQPWHDLHCRIEGPAANDVRKNFEQRWMKATYLPVIAKSLKTEHPTEYDEAKQIEKQPRIRKWFEALKKQDAHNALLKIDDVSCVDPFATFPDQHHSKKVDPENWHVQVFRSIDSDSVEEFPKIASATKQQNLVFYKDSAMDMSIQIAYIKAIRSAQHFIYIENQYFLGSSYAWPSYKNAGANNLIPMELALKIISKIRAKERFAVYVVIPMWPEGAPDSFSVQEILYWQGQTMQMMYKIIAQELESAQLENARPTDYLNFYCLGNREEPHTKANTHGRGFLSRNKESASHKYGRFMVYVHSKGMIVDDEYVIVGSANINQRSMAGSRDTEIAMGAYQPHHTWAKKEKHPHGQVYGYRMSLWAEHLGKIDDDCFKDPKSLDCVNKVNSVAEENWRRYIDEEFKEPLEGHILKYPIQVEGNGDVSHRPEHETFPDVGGKILGSLLRYMGGKLRSLTT